MVISRPFISPRLYLDDDDDEIYSHGRFNDNGIVQCEALKGWNKIQGLDLGCVLKGEQSTHRDWNVLLRWETYEDELDTMKIEEFIIDLIFSI